MRLWSLMAALLLLATAVMVAACGRNSNQPVQVSAKGSGNSTVATSATPQDNVRRVTITELRDMLEQSKAIVVDVRGTEAYKQEHIKGALDMPENQLSSRKGELPKDKLIVLYCS